MAVTPKIVYGLRRAADVRACPLCRGVDIVVRECSKTTAVRYAEQPIYQAVCTSCGTRGPEVESRPAAREEWNRLATGKGRL